MKLPFLWVEEGQTLTISYSSTKHLICCRITVPLRFQTTQSRTCAYYVGDAVLSTFQRFSLLIMMAIQSVINIIIPVFKDEKLKHKDVQYSRHTGGEGYSQNLNSSCLSPKHT